MDRRSDRSIETSDRYDLEAQNKRAMAWKLLQQATALSSQGSESPAKSARLIQTVRGTPVP